MKMIIKLFFLFSFNGLISAQNIVLDSIFENGGYTYISKPVGQGPFPGVLYSHGGLGGAIGGDLRGTCIALAQEGYICWAQLRTDTVPITPHVSEVDVALDSLINCSGLDINRVGIIGFSRGGLLTIMTAISHYSDVHAVVAMAPAAANNTLSNTLTQVSAIDDSVLLMVSLNDTFQDDHIQLVLDVENAFNNVVDYRSIFYDSYDSDNNGVVNSLDDGHELFWDVQEPYWSDLIFFLDNNLKSIATINEVNKLTNKLLVYPNPFYHQINISTSNKAQINKLSVYNSAGVLVKELSFINEPNYLLTKDMLTAGLYFIKVTTYDSQNYWEKVIVQ